MKHRTSLQYWGRFCPPPLALALLVFGLSWLLGLVREPLQITLGEDNRLDQLYLTTGFHQPESRVTTEANGSTVTYRWAKLTSYINLPWPTEAVPLKATLHLTAPRPNRSPDRGGTTLNVTGLLEWERLDLGQFDLTGLYEGSDYTFKIPLHLRPNLALLVLKFETSDLYPSSVSRDSRDLAVIFFSLTLEPDYAEFGWRGWLATFARPGLLATITFCIWGLASLILQNWREALLLEAGAGLTLLLSMVLWPLAAEPLYAAWAFILPLGWLLMALAILFSRRAIHLPTPFVYVATLFPIMPLAQFAFGRLDLYSLNPSSVIIGLYLCALLFSAAIYIAGNSAATFEQAFVRTTLVASFVSFAYAHFSLWQVRDSGFKAYYQVSLFNLTLTEPVSRIFNEGLLALCLVLLMKVFGGMRQGKHYTPAVLFLALNFGQITETISFGQYNLVVLLGLILMVRWKESGRVTKAGIALALPFVLKSYFALLLLFLLEKGRRAATIGGFVFGSLFLLALSVIVNGEKALPDYFSSLMAEFKQPSLDILNQSWWSFLGRLSLAEVGKDYNGRLATWIMPLGYVGMVVAIVLTVYLIWRNRCQTEKLERVRYLKLAALILLSLLIPNTVWIYATLPALLAILAVLLALDPPPTSRGQLFLFALTYAILAYGGRYNFFGDEAFGLARLGSSYRFFAALVLWILCLRSLGAARLNLTEESPQAEITVIPGNAP